MVKAASAITFDGHSVATFIAIAGISIFIVPLFGIAFGYTYLDVAMFLLMYLMSGLGITAGYHRLISHRSFDCRPWLKILLLIWGGWAFQYSAVKWCAEHRRHHAKCDTEDDPYNAKRGFWHVHILWILYRYDHRKDEKYAEALIRDPIVKWQYRHYPFIAASGFLLPFGVGFLEGGAVSGIGCLLLAGIARVFLVFNSTFCVNSFGHMVGTQQFTKADTSRDCWWVALITLGEGYHNYHHAFPRDYRNGVRWWDVDPTKWFIYAMSLVRITSSLHRATFTQVRDHHRCTGLG